MVAFIKNDCVSYNLSMSVENTRDSVRFVGHATVSVTLDGRHFLVDPNLSSHLAGLFKRHDTLGLDVMTLPRYAALLVTHAHYDHLDFFSYKYFSQKIPIVVPPRVAPFVKRFLNNPIIPLDHWCSKEIEGVRITALPAKHFGFRLSGLRYTGCNSYMVEGSKKGVYHAGDTAYGPHLAQIGNSFSIHTACLPIGPVAPRWFMKPRHLDPADALKAMEDLKATRMIPIHWGAFRLGTDLPGAPLEILQKEMQNHPAQSQVQILKPGESLPLE